MKWLMNMFADMITIIIIKKGENIEFIATTNNKSL